MGILREDKSKVPIRIEDEAVQNAPIIDYNDYVFDDSEEEPERVSPVPQQQPQRYVQRRKKCGERTLNRTPHVGDFYDAALLRKSSMGSRKWRRVENARLLLSLADPQDIRYDCSDIIPETISAFAKLLSSEENMKIWNDFIEKDEEEQHRILQEIDHICRSASHQNIKEARNENKSNKELPIPPPSSSNEQSFERMDKKFKSTLLRRRHLPYEFLDRIEDQIRNFFLSSPNGVYIEAIASKFKRFYFHAMAQYLTLKSSTLPATGPNKVIQLTNDYEEFMPPDSYLVPYLMKRRRSKFSSDLDEFELALCA